MVVSFLCSADVWRDLAFGRVCACCFWICVCTVRVIRVIDLFHNRACTLWSRWRDVIYFMETKRCSVGRISSSCGDSETKHGVTWLARLWRCFFVCACANFRLSPRAVCRRAWKRLLLGLPDASLFECASCVYWLSASHDGIIVVSIDKTQPMWYVCELFVRRLIWFIH